MTEAFGVRGRLGALEIAPALMGGEFDKDGLARLELTFAGRRLDIHIHNAAHKDPDGYHLAAAALDGGDIPLSDGKALLSREALAALDPAAVHTIHIYLE